MRSGVSAVLGALMLASVTVPGPALALDGYQAVKRALYKQVFASNRETLYCRCPFNDGREPDLGACGYQSPGSSERAGRIEVEHVVPASWIGEGRACWQKKICRDAKGRYFKGRKCCLKTDPAFRAAYQDLHNLWPTVGEVNEARRNYAFGMIDGERRAFGRCDIEVDTKTKTVEPRPEIRGDIARISLYMARTHHISLSADQRHLFERWHRADPLDATERRRNQIIKRIQGATNTSPTVY
ncbi:MAG: endonuclease I family protein [Geminicoccaceae bacterium]